MRYRTTWIDEGFSQELGKDLAIFDHDEGFPFLLSPFRRVEYTSYLNRYPNATVYSYSASPQNASACKKMPIGLPALAPELARRIVAIPALNPRPRRHRLGYCVFLANAERFLPRFEAGHIPFFFTLYPGGGFQLNDQRSDQALRNVCSSPCFRGVIATQEITRRYLIDGGFCRPDQITFVFGGVFPLEELKTIERRRYMADKETFDVGFVAFKYSPKGIEKGYDVFIDVVRSLSASVPQARFHIVGNFSPDDLPISDIAEKITFYGPRPTEFFPEFYSSLDVIVSANTPSNIIPGSFDGFPTGCCIEAGSCGVTVVCTDPLRLNGPFRNGEDMVIVPRDVGRICETLTKLAQHPDRLHNLSGAGQRTFRRVFSEREQLGPRHDLIDRLLNKNHSLKRISA